MRNFCMDLTQKPFPNICQIQKRRINEKISHNTLVIKNLILISSL